MIELAKDAAPVAPAGGDTRRKLFYQAASDAKNGIKEIVFFTREEE